MSPLVAAASPVYLQIANWTFLIVMGVLTAAAGVCLVIMLVEGVAALATEIGKLVAELVRHVAWRFRWITGVAQSIRRSVWRSRGVWEAAGIPLRGVAALFRGVLSVPRRIPLFGRWRSPSRRTSREGEFAAFQTVRDSASAQPDQNSCTADNDAANSVAGSAVVAERH